MLNEYFCPHCNTALKVNQFIILTAASDHGNKGIVLFEPKLGDYNFIKHKDNHLTDQSRVEFFCPVCHINLSSDKKNLAEIIMIDSEGDQYSIWFSKIVGEQATYKIKAGKVMGAYGEHREKYMNFFGTGPQY